MGRAEKYIVAMHYILSAPVKDAGLLREGTAAMAEKNIMAEIQQVIKELGEARDEVGSAAGYASKKGLLLIRCPKGSAGMAEVVNPKGFAPKLF